MQKILPSLHMLELFFPLVPTESFFVGLLDEARRIPFYKGLELPEILEKQNRDTVRRIVEEDGYQLTVWSSPSITENGYNLASLDGELREKSVEFAIEMIKNAADMGTTNIGIPCGPDPGDADRPEALKGLSDSYHRMSAAAAEFEGVHLTFEPLDRYAHKKQILGPIREVIEWFEVLKKDCPNMYIHWDSAHEALGNIDLVESMKVALPYMAQFHICNCVTDPTHPYYGDWHMDIGMPPEYRNWGYLDVNVAAELLRTAAQAGKVEGVKNTHVAVEVRTHKGNDCWKTERGVREFLMAAYDRAGLEYDR